MEPNGYGKLILAVFGRECIEEVISEWLSSLTVRERAVIELRFGLRDDTSSKTLQEVGQELEVSRERIRQIESKALRSIRLIIGFNRMFYRTFHK